MSQGLNNFISSFLWALHMPRLEALSLSIDFKNMGDNESTCAELLSQLSTALLPTQLADPRARLSHLDYEFTYDPNGGYFHSSHRTPLRLFPRIFPIPLERIPTVTNLIITQVIFAWEGTFDATGNNEPCALREIRFSGCQDMEIGDFRLELDSLSTEDWDNLERVVVENCAYLNYEEVLEVVVKEKLRYSI